ncbi:MAG: E3 binding domain-containing protein, partial [Rubrobacteraceae bacterium]
DRIEETVEDMDVADDGGVGERLDKIEDRLDSISKTLDAPADTSATDGLSERMDRVEGKLDQLLAALENVSSNGNVPIESAPKATDAARRKARDMNVDLAEVNGTGAGGRITVEDVRKKGES